MWSASSVLTLPWACRGILCISLVVGCEHFLGVQHLDVPLMMSLVKVLCGCKIYIFNFIVDKLYGICIFTSGFLLTYFYVIFGEYNLKI